MIRNKACEFADARAKVLTERIVVTFKQAAREVAKNMTDFTARHDKQDAKYRQKVTDGKMTEAKYKTWLQSEVYAGQRWQKKLDDITKIYLNADKIAAGIIRSESINVFGKASNLTADAITRHFGGAVTFSPLDKRTIEYLLKSDRKLLPEYKVNEKKDYAWNSQRVQNAVMQGIIQGESVQQIAKRLSVELASKNAAKMNMFARTAVTSARTQGQLERMREAVKKGVKLMKQWMTMGDERVRETHDEVDGDVREIDEQFDVGGAAMDGPGDPSAPLEEVMNCRCWLVEYYPR